MAKYLLISSRDPFETNDANAFYDLAVRLARNGDDVTFFLVQNGVLPARAGAQARGLENVNKAGVTILADEFSLRERGIDAGSLNGGAKAAPLDVVVDQLADGAKTLWN